MADRVPIAPVAGRFSYLEGQDVNIGSFGTDQRVITFNPTVISPPSSAPCVVELRNAAGTETIQATIGIGDSAPASPASGIINLNVGDSLFQRIVASGGASDLSGWYELESTGSVPLVVQLTTVPNVKQRLGLVDSSQDAYLQTLIEQVSAQIVNYVSHDIVQNTYIDEVHDGGWAKVVPRHFPVSAIMGARWYGSDLDVTDIRVEDGGRTLQRMSGNIPSNWERGNGSITIDYQAGYSEIPDDITMAADRQVAYEFQHTGQSNRNQLGLEQVTQADGGNTVFLTGEWEKGAYGLLQPYRIIHG